MQSSERKCSFSTSLQCSKDKLAQVTKEFNTFLDIFQAYQKKKRRSGLNLIQRQTPADVLRCYHHLLP